MTNLATDLILGNILLFQNTMEISYKHKQIIILKDGFTQIIPMNKQWYWTINSGFNLLHPYRKTDRLFVNTNYPSSQYKTQTTSINYEFKQQISLRDRQQLYAYIGTDWADNNKKSIRLYNASTNPKTIKFNTLVGYMKPETLRTHNVKRL